MSNPDHRALCVEQLPELRGMFERILCIARSFDGPAVGNIELADRLIDAVVSWSESSLAQPEPVAPTDDELDEFAVFWWGSDIDERTVADVIECGSMTAYGRAFHAHWGNYPVKPDSSPANTINQED